MSEVSGEPAGSTRSRTRDGRTPCPAPTAATTDVEQLGHALRGLYLGALYRWCGRPEAAADQLTDELLTILDLVLLGIQDTRPSPA
ncbi:hypothetical protein [Streptomyces sp. NRRL F-4489]|uniref:hypothetical protein n=1 Tax=Streptomyces sp. NRRL F-4489 TaxID=1609095 RepID=UPI000A8EA415|nr:hypothetical protein [Streptomyces sp. NRRL F-4489]